MLSPLPPPATSTPRVSGEATPRPSGGVLDTTLTLSPAAPSPAQAVTSSLAACAPCNIVPALEIGLAGRPRVALIAAPTPVARLTELARAMTGGADVDLWVKREDLTAPGYGGNKVRNLEYLLGDALARGHTELVTVAPVGSNFVAAMASQARRVGMGARVAHFHAQRPLPPQVEAHARYTAAQGAILDVVSPAMPRNVAAAIAGAFAYGRAARPNTRMVSPGGTELLGVFGHVGAALELGSQVRAGLLPAPTSIVVGAGTCGTVAGLLVGLRMAGLSTRVVGVRCVDPLWCHPRKIVRLANAARRSLVASMPQHALALRSPITLDDVTLIDPPQPAGSTAAYGAIHPDARRIATLAATTEDLALDTTYTSKVVLTLEHLVKTQALPTGPVLYWHTYSGAAYTM